MPSIIELQPYFTAIATFLSVATLGFVMRMALFMRDAEKQRAAIIEERLVSTKEELARTEKWSAREKAQLTELNESLRSQLEEVLAGSGITVQALASGASLKEAQESIQQAVSDLLSRMEEADRLHGGIVDPGWHLELAKGYMAKLDWRNAAFHFDRYAEFNPTDADMQFSRGVAHANTRTDTLPALRAYNEAIAFVSESVDSNMRAKYFAYRGAMLKRMGRLQEAESDLKLALPLATHDYEIHDIKYNLAAVYAMQGKKAEMLAVANDLRYRPRELAAIRYHFKDYFLKFADDPDLLEITRTKIAG